MDENVSEGPGSGDLVPVDGVETPPAPRFARPEVEAFNVGPGM